jgi:mono/diheme cytochrome c family protein
MNPRHPPRSRLATGTVGVFLCAALTLATGATRMVAAGLPWSGWWHRHRQPAGPPCADGGCAIGEDGGGEWYWLGSPEQQKRITVDLFNRYCIRCHGVDGRGVWDVPDVPDFTNPRWQACRTDAQLVRIILEGRGAVMPAFRGTLTLEEAWSMARYLRSFLPGSEDSRPDLGDKAGGKAKERQPATSSPKKP